MNAVCQKCNNEGSDFGCNTSIVKDEAAGDRVADVPAMAWVSRCSLSSTTLALI